MSVAGVVMFLLVMSCCCFNFSDEPQNVIQVVWSHLLASLPALAVTSRVLLFFSHF